MYTFKHALTHEVAYGSLLQERRRLLHGRIVAALEQRHADRLAEQVEPLARHAFRGAVWDKAVTYGQQAGARAADRAAFRQAATDFEQALAALGYLPDTSATRGLAIDLRLGLAGRALFQLGEYAKSLTLLRESEAMARAYDNQAQLAQVLARLAFVLRHKADLAGALAAGQQALALATALGDVALQEGAAYFLGQAYYGIGDYRQAADLFRRNVEAQDPGTGHLDRPYRSHSQAWLTFAVSQLGQFTDGRCHGEEALRLATEEGRGTAPMFAYGCLGRLYLAQGDLAAALRLLDQGLALCRATDNWDVGRVIAAALGYACALTGRLVEGRALHNQSRYSAWLSAVCLLEGCPDEARQHARQALALARQYGERGHEAFALYQLGAAHAHAEPPDGAQAAAHYQQALTLANELGMRPLQARCHHALGPLYATVGQREQTRTALATAIEMYRAMDMTFWLPQAEAALAQMA